MKEWTKAWTESKKPAKQRKYVYQAPLHIRTSFMGSHLSKELQKKYGTRTLTVRKGDKVKIERGDYKGITGKINRVDRKNIRIYVDGAQRTKSDGSKSFYALHPSNVLIIDLHTDDKRRMKRGKQK